MKPGITVTRGEKPASDILDPCVCPAPSKSFFDNYLRVARDSAPFGSVANPRFHGATEKGVHVPREFN